MKLLCEYKKMVCSSRYEFIVNLVDSCLDLSDSKTIILSRLLENLSIVCIVLEIKENNISDTSF